LSHARPLERVAWIRTRVSRPVNLRSGARFIPEVFLADFEMGVGALPSWPQVGWAASVALGLGRRAPERYSRAQSLSNGLSGARLPPVYRDDDSCAVDRIASVHYSAAEHDEDHRRGKRGMMNCHHSARAARGGRARGSRRSPSVRAVWDARRSRPRAPSNRSPYEDEGKERRREAFGGEQAAPIRPSAVADSATRLHDGPRRDLAEATALRNCVVRHQW